MIGVWRANKARLKCARCHDFECGCFVSSAIGAALLLPGLNWRSREEDTFRASFFFANNKNAGLFSFEINKRRTKLFCFFWLERKQEQKKIVFNLERQDGES